MNIFGHNDEKAIAEGIRRGENRAMRDFYAQFGGQLAAVCSRYVTQDNDVQDVMQDAMISIIEHIDNFKYHGKGSLRAWATRIVVNQALNFIKAKRRQNDTFADKDIGNIFYVVDYIFSDIGEIPAEKIHEMIRDLPDGYRMVLNLYAIEGKSHKVISYLLFI